MPLQTYIQNKKRKNTPDVYWEDRMSGLVAKFEDELKKIQQGARERINDAVFGYLEPSKEIARDVAQAEIKDFKQDVGDRVNQILDNIKQTKKDILDNVDKQIEESRQALMNEVEKLLQATVKEIGGQSYDFENKLNKAYVQIKENSQQAINKVDSAIVQMGNKVDKLKPQEGKQGVAGKDGKDGSPDSAVDIAKKLNTLEGRIDQNVIKGLPQLIRNLQRSIQSKKGGGGQSGGGMGDVVHDQFDGDGSTTEFTLTNRVAASGNAVMACRYEGQVQYLGDQYTISGKTLTFTFTPENGTKIEITYIRT